MEILLILFIGLILLGIFNPNIADTADKILSDTSEHSTEPTKPSNFGYVGIHMSHEQKLQYMESKKWWEIKQQKLQEQPHCQICNAGHPLVIHHITYERLGNESLSDLAVLCRPCHEKLHQKAGYSRYRTYPISILGDKT